jgi:GLPGLI family protein
MFGCFVSVNLAFGQPAEGVITYESRGNLQRNSTGKQEGKMKAIVPEAGTVKQQLFFNVNESLYKPVEEEEEDFESGGVRIRFGGSGMEIYTDKTNTLRITQQEFMGRNYLIEDTLKVVPWKFGAGMKTILGYECRQACLQDESGDQKREITAWYTDQIRLFLGPEIFNSLPGTVLAVDVNNGERVIVAIDIQFRPLKKNELKAPRSGTRITQEEFRKIMEEQMEQMHKRGGNMIIR